MARRLLVAATAALLARALRPPTAARPQTRLRAAVSTQPFLYDNADTLSERYASYEDVCEAAAVDDVAFATFKRDPAYVDVLEHVSYDVGRMYHGRAGTSPVGLG